MKRPFSIRPVRLVFAFAVMGIAAFGLWILCGLIASNVFTGCSPSNLKELESAGQFQLPPSAKNLKSGCIGMQGWDGHADFDMSPSDLNLLVTSTKLSNPLVLNEMPKDSNLVTIAKQAKSYLHGRYDYYNPKTDTTFYQEILVDTSEPTSDLVYLRSVAVEAYLAFIMSLRKSISSDGLKVRRLDG